MIQETIDFIRSHYESEDFIPLHEPYFAGNEKKYLNECIDTTFVSSVGKFVDKFEKDIANFTGSKFAIATVNGTSALHIALQLAGVEREDEVLTQSLTFIATCNAISYIGANPVFIDVDKNTMGLSPEKLKQFLSEETIIKDEVCINKKTKRKIKAVIPMHTFGMPINIDDLKAVCEPYNIKIIEDAAESLGSYDNHVHTGTKGLAGTLSFNGNKTITTGGGGMILTNDEHLARKAKHITTTAKIPHRWDFKHDQIGYNYRMPNINAALGCAQLEKLPEILQNKRDLAQKYVGFFNNKSARFVTEPDNTSANYWLNSIVLENPNVRDEFLSATNDAGVMTRPIWKLMSSLPMFKKAQKGNLDNSIWLEERVINIPSSVKK
ncbi:MULTISPECIES: LegC family aminotransferase [Maribacter]|uniref:GDP-perosamine synthase n=1 Tax=Maribacter stanieri TaxID=440514 RepID=A0A1I6HU86_9FLAO|nr:MULTISPECIES: LegC family aminotransferase [Maribacter]SFR58021.1 aminotransferase, LLPSF_NHT_00031 family [Maribacter stanieri]|tara:strand:- start:4762 stop:5901 length:1140 start_codon:yes stop_codon:yes gene_type:complete